MTQILNFFNIWHSCKVVYWTLIISLLFVFSAPQFLHFAAYIHHQAYVRGEQIGILLHFRLMAKPILLQHHKVQYPFKIMELNIFLVSLLSAKALQCHSKHDELRFIFLRRLMEILIDVLQSYRPFLLAVM